MVIGPNGEQMGLKKLNDALTLANYAGLDLVLMNAGGNPAVAKDVESEPKLEGKNMYIILAPKKDK